MVAFGKTQHYSSESSALVRAMVPVLKACKGSFRAVDIADLVAGLSSARSTHSSNENPSTQLMRIHWAYMQVSPLK